MGVVGARVLRRSVPRRAPAGGAVRRCGARSCSSSSRRGRRRGAGATPSRGRSTTPRCGWATATRLRPLPGRRRPSWLARPPARGRAWVPVDQDGGGGRDGDRRDPRRGSRARPRGGVGDAAGGRERQPRGRAARLARPILDAGDAERDASAAICTTAPSSASSRCASASCCRRAPRRRRGAGHGRAPRRRGRPDDRRLREVAHGVYPRAGRSRRRRGARGRRPPLAIPISDDTTAASAATPKRSRRRLLLLRRVPAERRQARRPGALVTIRLARPTATSASPSRTTASASTRRRRARRRARQPHRPSGRARRHVEVETRAGRGTRVSGAVPPLTPVHRAARSDRGDARSAAVTQTLPQHAQTTEGHP